MYTSIIRPILFKLPPETAHWFTFQALQFYQSIPFASSILEKIISPIEKPVHLMGLNFRNSVGVAAGLDKNAALIRSWKSLGFGFAEIGTVTPRAQTGNPKPRLFRIPEDQAFINRMGFNNEGIDAIIQRLRNRPKDFIVGGNIGKNTDTSNAHAAEDYTQVFNSLYPFVDYLVINVSCPNINNLNLLQERKQLELLLSTLITHRNRKPVQKPVVLKISPDLNDHQLDDTLQLVNDFNIDGIIATNTSKQRPPMKKPDTFIQSLGDGGLSGKPIADFSTQMIQKIRAAMGNDFPIIASGGIVSSDEAQAKWDAGADLLQLYTGFIYQGISFIKKCYKCNQYK